MGELEDHAEGVKPCLIMELPTEIIQHIAYLLPKDSDIINFALTCFSLAEMIIPAESTVWCNRFRDVYDDPRKMEDPKSPTLNYNFVALKYEYQIRATVLRQIKFNHGEKEQHKLWLKVIQRMLLESITLPIKNSQSGSKNFEYLRGVLSGSEFLNRPVCGYGEENPSPPSDLFCAVQLCLTDLALDPGMSVRCLRSDYNIAKVYSYQADIETPLVDITKLDLEHMLHIRNFWLRHLMNPDEATFYDSFASLPEYHRPKGRRGFPGKDLAISEHWLGYTSCIHPYPESLASFEVHQSCADLDGHLVQVEPISFQAKQHQDTANWPLLFQEIIPIMGKGRDRTYFRGIQAAHGINDSPACLVRGFVEPVLEPQGAFPDWKRICFAIYEPNHERLMISENATEMTEDEALWFPKERWPPHSLENFNVVHGYEGVMLPGERIIMGRFVDMHNTYDRGPFIFWDL